MRRRVIGWLLLLAGLAALTLAVLAYAGRAPQDMPWTALDLGQPVGLFTGRKLAALNEEPTQCRAILSRAGIRYTALPARNAGQDCPFEDALRLAPGGSRSVALSPAEAGMRCPVAAALALWEWHVLQPAAQRHLGARVTAIEHLGTYSCRRINGRDEGDWSEHASANAIDIAAIRLSDGRRISVLRDWSGDPSSAAFLRDARDGACDLFATVLSPDYNAAHRDHLHLDQAARGARGWRGCR